MSATLLSSHDLAAIKRRAFTGKLVIGGDPAVAEAATTRRMTRKKASDARASKWGDTLMAQRAKKAQDRVKREEAAEAARVVLDKEEEELAAQERLKVLRHANDLIVGQTERMKLLKQQKVNSDVQDVRQRQLAFKERRKAMEKARELDHHKELMKQIEADEARERAARAKEAEKRAAIALSQQKQKDEFIERYIGDLKSERAEGLRIKEAAIKAEEEDRRKAAEVAANAKLRNLEMAKANETMRRLRDAARAKEEAEALAHERYALEKERELRRREDFVEYKRAEAEKRATSMRDAMERDFTARASNEEARVESQVAEADAKKAAAEEEAARRRAEMNAACRKSREAQLERKRRAKEAERREAARFKDEWSGIQKDMEAEERAEKLERKKNAVRLQTFLLRQAAEKDAGMRSAKARDLEDERGAASKYGAGDEEFKALADDLIKEEIRRGHNPVVAARTVQRALAGEKLIPANAMF